MKKHRAPSSSPAGGGFGLDWIGALQGSVCLLRSLSLMLVSELRIDDSFLRVCGSGLVIMEMLCRLGLTLWYVDYEHRILEKAQTLIGGLVRTPAFHTNQLMVENCPPMVYMILETRLFPEGCLLCPGDPSLFTLYKYQKLTIYLELLYIDT